LGRTVPEAHGAPIHKQRIEGMRDNPRRDREQQFPARGSKQRNQVDVSVGGRRAAK
jgi:hypothetical protein